MAQHTLTNLSLTPDGNIVAVFQQQIGDKKVQSASILLSQDEAADMALGKKYDIIVALPTD